MLARMLGWRACEHMYVLSVYVYARIYSVCECVCACMHVCVFTPLSPSACVKVGLVPVRGTTVGFSSKQVERANSSARVKDSARNVQGGGEGDIGDIDLFTNHHCNNSARS